MKFRFPVIQDFPKYIIATLLVLLIIPGVSFSDNKLEKAKLPDVLIWIDARNPGAQWVSLTYPTVLKRENAENQVKELLKSTDWAATNIKISDESLMSSGENPMTSVEFETPYTIGPDNTILPLEAIILPLKDIGDIEILYLAPTGYNFRGLKDFENKFVKIQLKQAPGSYRYIIHVKDSSFTKLDLPLLQVKEREIKPKRSVLSWIMNFLVFVLALIMAFLAYIITDRIINKSRRRTH